MNYKILFLFIISSLLIIIIYNFNYERNIKIVSINETEFNDKLSNFLSKSNINYTLNIDYSNKNLEIENLIATLDNNKDYILDKIHKADYIIVNIGFLDYEQEDINTILEELTYLFKKIRKINTKKIVYIIPKNYKKTVLIKELCRKYNITCIDKKSFNYNDNIIIKYIFKDINNKNG